MKVTSIFYFLIIFAFMLVGCGGEESAPTVSETVAPSTNTPQPETAYVPRLEKRPCQTYNPNIGEKESQTYSCGVMIVPQDRSQPDGKQIEIKYAIANSLSNSPQPDPMLFLSGGPGNSALHPDGFAELVNRFAPMRQERDIILFDQRGVGASSPQVDCTTVPKADDANREALLQRYNDETGFTPPFEDAFQANCVMNLWDQGIELPHYNSTASAADTMDLMLALRNEHGYTSYNLYGISYGTRLAETIARDFANDPLIRSITLDSVFPRPVGEYDASYFTGKHEMFDHLFAACASDNACNDAYPDLKNRFFTLVDQLNNTSLNLPDQTTFDGSQLYQMMFPFEDRGPGWIPVIPYLPKMIAELEQGDTVVLMGLRDGTIPPQTSEPYTPPDAVYEMLDLSTCTAVSEEAQRNDLYRQMYNVTIEESRVIINTLCTPEEAVRFLQLLETMKPTDVNEFVKRVYNSPVRSSSPFVRTQFNCREAFAYGEDAPTIEANMNAAQMPDFLTQQAVENVVGAAKTCAGWPSGITPATDMDPISSNYPALLINGEWDYVTYPKWAEAVNDRWSRSFYLFVPNGMHSILSNYGECPTAVTLQFLNDPTSSPDMSCADNIRTEWVLP